MKVYRSFFIAFFWASLVFVVLAILVSLASRPSGFKIEVWDRPIVFFERLERPGRANIRGFFDLAPGSLRQSELAVVFPKVIANEMKVFVNGHLVHVAGSSSGNIWPAPVVARVPSDLLRSGKNEIELELYAHVNYGIAYPPFVTDYESALKKASLIKLLRNDLNFLAIGASLLLAYVFFFLSRAVPREFSRRHLYIGFSSAFTALGLLQFIERQTTFADFLYLIFEGLALTLPVLNGTLIYFFINERHDRMIPEVRARLLLATGIAFPLASVLIPTPGGVHVVARLVNIYSLFLLLLTLWQVLKLEAKEVYFSISFLYLTAVQSIAVLASNSPSELLLPYGRIAFVIQTGLEAIRYFRNVTQRKEQLELENFIDNLTGVFNRKYIDVLEKRGTLVLLDLDGFKAINDRYGHRKGDEVLKEFAEIMKANLRVEDVIIRLGGDEFAIVVKSDSNVQKIVERLYNASRNLLGLGFSYGLASLDTAESFDEAYHIADVNLYRCKNSRKTDI